MDPNKMRPISAAANVKASGWKSTEQRNIMVKKMAEFLIKQGPASWALDIPGLMKSVERFEEKVFASSKDETEYIAMISAKMKAVRPSRLSDEFNHSSSNISAGSGAEIEADPEWKEQVYQRVQTIRGTHFTKLNILYKCITRRLEQRESNVQQPKTPEIEKCEHHKRLLEYIFALFQVNRSQITPNFKQRLDRVEKYICTIEQPRNSSENRQTFQPNIGHLQDHQAANQFNSSQPQLNQMSHASDDSSTAMQHLIKALTSVSNEALFASCEDIGMVVHMNDDRSKLEPLNELATSAIDTNLKRVVVTDTQARYLTCDNFVTSGGKINRFINSMPASDRLYSTRAEKSHSNPVNTQENDTLFEEIKVLNNQLIDTEVIIDKEKNIIPGVFRGASEQSEGLIVKLFFNAVTINDQNLKLEHDFNKKTIIKPLTLHVPSSYPKCSPIILDEMPEISKDQENLSKKARLKLQLSLQSLDEPISLVVIAKSWECCAREAICEYAQCRGGGTFTSKYGGWETCTDDS